MILKMSMQAKITMKKNLKVTMKMKIPKIPRISNKIMMTSVYLCINKPNQLLNQVISAVALSEASVILHFRKLSHSTV